MLDHLTISKQGNSYILYDASLVSEPVHKLFTDDYRINNNDQQNNSSLTNLEDTTQSKNIVGRAKVVYFQHKAKPMVRKHYFRGGLISALLKDQYLGFFLENTRAFKEFRLLKKMQQLGLPVPVAVAARVEKSLFYFRADLITLEIENVKTLVDLISLENLSEAGWTKIGSCIKQFHQHDIYHADLNAGNILISGDTSNVTKTYLIDFDRCAIRSGTSSWKMQNLQRLKRSLIKFKNNNGCCFTEDNWSALLSGYNNV